VFTPFTSSRAALLGLAALALPWVAAADTPKPADTPKFPARTFTFKEADVSLDKALDELQKQTDVAVDRTRADTSRSLKVDCARTPFWEALERIAKGSDHRIVFADHGQKIMLVTGEGMAYKELPLSIDGPFRVAATRVGATIDLDNDRSICDLHLTLHWEPHFTIFLVEPPGEKVTARDNTDRQLQVAEMGKGRLPAAGGGTQLVLRLLDVPRVARTLRVVEGKFAVVGSGSQQRFEFAAPGVKELVEKKDDVTVKVRTDFKEGSDLWTAYLAIEYPEGGPQIESFESAAWTAGVRGALVSADGKRRVDVNGGEEWVNQTDRSARVNYRWVPDENTKLGKPADWKLVVQTPGKFVETTVNFKLENIPLP
jgi:hypothetical protein